MKKLTTLSILLISLAFVAPIQVSAATNAGVKPGSFFYFFDTTFENVSLFFTFNPEKKAQKALEYAGERLAEIEAVAEEKNPDAVKTAITNYESNIALATEKSKEIKDKGQAETLLNSIADNNSRNQDVLTAVLIKVPEEAKAAITQAIEASRKRQDEATKQIAELKGEVEQLKKDVAELKTEDETQTTTIEEPNKQKSENISVPTKSATPQSATIPISKSTTLPQSQTQTKVSEPQNIPTANPSPSITTNTPSPTTQPQTATPPPTTTQIAPPVTQPTTIPTPTPTPATQSTTPFVLNIPNSITVSASKRALNKKGEGVDILATVKDISGNPVPDQTVIFENGYSHAETITNSNGIANVCFIGDYDSNNSNGMRETKIITKTLIPAKNTFLQDELIINAPIDNNIGNPSRLQQGHLYDFRCPASLDFSTDQNISLGSSFNISWHSYNMPDGATCNASGNWTGDKPLSGSENLSFSKEGNYTYILTCSNESGFLVTKTSRITVTDTTPKIFFLFNGNESTTNAHTAKIGDTIRLGWYTKYSGGTCTASGDWSGAKIEGNSDILTFTQAGTFNYTLTCMGSSAKVTNTATITATQ